MNKVIFQQPKGFPWETDTFTFMQDAYNLLQCLGSLSGDQTIIKGCLKNGTRVSDGMIYFNGEILPFKGGIEQTKVVLRQNVKKVEFQDTVLRDAYVERWLEFGTGINSFLWKDFKRVKTLEEISNKLDWLEPIHKEVKWVGRSITNAELPAKWYIADGRNGTDNILGRMIIGFDPYQSEFDAVGNTGGTKQERLEEGHLPRHKHSKNNVLNKFSAKSLDLGNESSPGNLDYTDREHEYGLRFLGSGYSWEDATEQYVGNNIAHNNLPPYIVQVPIQYIK